MLMSVKNKERYHSCCCSCCFGSWLGIRVGAQTSIKTLRRGATGAKRAALCFRERRANWTSPLTARRYCDVNMANLIGRIGKWSAQASLLQLILRLNVTAPILQHNGNEMSPPSPLTLLSFLSVAPCDWPPRSKRHLRLIPLETPHCYPGIPGSASMLMDKWGL